MRIYKDRRVISFSPFYFPKKFQWYSAFKSPRENDPIVALIKDNTLFHCPAVIDVYEKVTAQTGAANSVSPSRGRPCEVNMLPTFTMGLSLYFTG